MASIEPPSLSSAAGSAATGPGTPSSRTSMTRISLQEGENDAGDSVIRNTTSQEVAPESKSSTPAMSDSEPKAEQQSQGVDGVDTSTEATVPQTPQTCVTFLLISGRRRTMSFGPETTVGRVKELVWNAWPTEWESERPLAPSYMRILYLGKMLQDDDTLAKLKFPTYMPQSEPSPTPTIVHLSVRPFATAGDNDLPKKKRGRAQSGDTQQGDSPEDSGSSSCCCIIC